MALSTPFAQNGDKKEIPQNSSNGSVSFNNGFGSLYALPPEEGGLFIDRAQFNQLMFDTTSQVLENKQAITTKANANATVNLTGNQTIAGVKTFSSVPVCATAPTNANQVANKAYVDSVGNTKLNISTYNTDKATFATKTELTNGLNAKANANATVNLTGNQTIAGIKTFSSPVVVPNATTNNHAVNLAQLNTKANQATTYNKNEVNNLLNAKIDSTKASKILTENLVKTVGARGADFANLRQALEWASQYSYSGGRFTITLRCNADMPIPGIYVPIGEALIIIDGQNNTFNCDNQYFMTAAMNKTEANGGIFNSNIIIKNFTLNYNDITTSAYGCAFQLTGINATFDNITININNSNINNNLIIFVNANCYITNLKINCSGNTNIPVNVILGTSSTIICATPRLNLSNLTGQITALFLLSFSKALLNSNSNIPLPTDKIQAHIGIYQGSLVVCNNEFSKFSQSPNTLTANGIIFR